MLFLLKTALQDLQRMGFNTCEAIADPSPIWFK